MNLKLAARKFAHLWHRERDVKGERKELGDVLREKIHEAGIMSIDLGKESVVIEAGTKKEPTKSDIVAFFGEEQAEKFWSQLKASKYEYLTVVPVKEKRKAM